jgi:Protein of unknown function (DUF2844)
MAFLIQQEICSRNSAAGFARATLCVFCLVLPAFAALGDSSDSVLVDQAQMQASLKVTHFYLYTVHELKLPTGTIIREYVGQNNRVFGVAWQGPFIPSMRQLLGNYFLAYSEAAQAQVGRRVGRQRLKISEPSLAVLAGGHMLDYWGRAYDPQLVPSGVTTDDIR